MRTRWAGPSVWSGRSMANIDGWIVRLTDNELTEIRTAIDAGKASGKPIGELGRTDFVLNELGGRLTEIRDDLLEGKGFALIRGLPVDDWSDEDLMRAYWGIGSWLGDPVSQNAKAHLLGHVIDQRSDPYPGKRIYQTNQALSFHSDSCDIVGLLCLREAKTGGLSALASSAAVHNALLDNDPDAFDCLYGDFQCDRYGEIPEGKRAFYNIHIFNEVDSKFVCCAMDPDIRSAQRLNEVGPLSVEQGHALDAFQETAKALSLEMRLKRGDIQLVNNLTVVHAREPYEDYVELDRRRYLVRLWLSSPLGRVLPGFMAERWGNIEVGSLRGGIIVPGATPAVHLDPGH